ncbi:MAG: DinB family protein [Flavobacteriales bacterium]|nr:DinB family protein [Flavobacteriales bacterium]
MKLSAQIAKHFREIHFGGNWTCSNLKDSLSDVDWKMATTKVYDFNTIATLAYHIHYYVHAVAEVLEGKPLDASDKLSFDHPPINNNEDWNTFLEKVWADAERFANTLEQLEDEKMGAILEDQKYGTYYRNLHGIIEHSHYHLGQINLIKKLVRESLE